MGRKTLESFPNGQPLKNRVNIVLTSDKNYKVKDAIVVHDLDELHKELEQYNSEDVYVIGGESIYRQLLDECDVAHITKIDYAYDADAYSRIWMKRKNGRLQKTVMNRPILIWSITS